MAVHGADVFLFYKAYIIVLFLYYSNLIFSIRDLNI